MSLVPCPECGHQISTKATSCPNCGEPIVLTPQRFARDLVGSQATPRWGRIGAVIVFAVIPVFALVLWSAPTVENSPQPSQAASLAAAPPPPQKHWSAKVGNSFAYKRELSANDQAAGLATAPMLLVNYRGHHDNRYEFATTQGGPDVTLVTCEEPCEIASLMSTTGQRFVPVESGSQLWAFVEDAKHGFLGGDPPDK